MFDRKLLKFGGAFVLFAGLLTGCSDSPTTPTTLPERQADVGHAYRPLECPNQQLVSKTKLLTPLGGLLAIQGVSISLPFGAVTLPTLITIKTPVSAYREVDITANGLLHFLFNTPATVSIDYAGCNVDRTYPLKVFYWENGELLEDMNAVDNPYSEKITFTTGHLSGYVIAN
jgi:hypothetical protein